MTKTEKLRVENPDFDLFYLDSPEDDDTIDQFVEHIDQWPSNLKSWTYVNRWV